MGSSMRRYLGALGLTAPFAPTHDLDTLLVPPPPKDGMLVNQVLHKVFIQVDEKGAHFTALKP